MYFDPASSPETAANKQARIKAAATMTAFGGNQNVVADTTSLARDPIEKYKGVWMNDYNYGSLKDNLSN